MKALNLILTGFMGTGKTTVGRILAQRLERPFLDMDAVIEERESRTIAAIFAAEGEPHFRAIERRLVQELAARDGLVIATGGGVVLNPLNVRDFERTGLLVCLDAAPERILARIAHETQRPLLAVPEREQRLRDLLAGRQTAYAAVAFHVDTDVLDPEQVAGKILDKLAL